MQKDWIRWPRVGRFLHPYASVPFSVAAVSSQSDSSSQIFLFRTFLAQFDDKFNPPAKAVTQNNKFLSGKFSLPLCVPSSFPCHCRNMHSTQTSRAQVSSFSPRSNLSWRMRACFWIFSRPYRSPALVTLDRLLFRSRVCTSGLGCAVLSDKVLLFSDARFKF